jgi:hypothetical protein
MRLAWRRAWRRRLTMTWSPWRARTPGGPEQKAGEAFCTRNNVRNGPSALSSSSSSSSNYAILSTEHSAYRLVRSSVYKHGVGIREPQGGGGGARAARAARLPQRYARESERRPRVFLFPPRFEEAGV